MVVHALRALALAAVLAAGVSSLPNLVAAQTSMLGPNAMGGKPPAAAPKVPQPPALPGATSNPSQAAPPTRAANDMEPTEALFDAINRGDIAAARDAVSRGADLGGRNLLGMTPLDLSIDLARKDITFMLLSMRGGDSAPNRGPPTPAAEKLLEKAARQAARQPARTTRTATGPVIQPAVPQKAKLFANDGGSPIPNAGFLGFDASRR